MALLNHLPLETFKKLENRAASMKAVFGPLKKLSRGYSPFPWVVVAHVTYRCNLDCEMCVQHIPELQDQLPAFPSLPVKTAQELAPARWKAIFEDIAQSFKVRPLLHLSGGEPTLYLGLLDLIAHARSLGFSTSVITNGWTLAANAEELVRLGVERVNVSVDGSEDIHDTVRRMKGSYRRAVAGIRALKDARTRAGSARPFITINCTVTPRNYRLLDQLVRVRDESGADALTIEHLIFLDSERSLATGIDGGELKSTLSRLERQHGVTTFPYIPDEDWQTYYGGRSEDLGKGCSMLWTGLRIHPNGEVGPCRGLSMGSLGDGSVSVSEIWNNAKYRSSRREIADEGNVDACGRCCHRLY